MGMKINIVHDDRLIDRYGFFMEELIKQGITNYKIWNIVEDSRSVVRSISLSHKQIVRDAKEKGLKEVCIAEDDIMFTCDGAWEYFLNNKPKEFDIYLWGTYIPPISNNMICGFQLYIVNEKFYDTFLSVDENCHIDTEISNIGGDFKFCYPFPALQRSSWSANNKALVNYNAVLKPEDIWQGFLL